MFLNNKYAAIYFKIVSTSDTNVNYFETHHIIPRSLGGSDDPSNLVKLSARKHFLCHYLLTKMLKPNTSAWYKMVKAFMMMGNCSSNQQRHINSRLYESQRIAFSETQSASQSGSKNSQFGTKWVHKGTESFKIKLDDLQNYLSLGYSEGKYKQPKPKKVSMRDTELQKEKTFLLPFLQRFLNGESLRQIAPDYGKSHVSLHLRLKYHFSDQLENVKQGSLKR